MVNTGMAFPKNYWLYNYEINFKVMKTIMDLVFKNIMGYLNIHDSPLFGNISLHLNHFWVRYYNVYKLHSIIES